MSFIHSFGRLLGSRVMFGKCGVYKGGTAAMMAAILKDSCPSSGYIFLIP
jgi:hypothetical protein